VQADRGARSNQTPFLAGEQNAAYLAAFTRPMAEHSLTTSWDFFLPLLTNGKATQDQVGPHKDLLAEFPYVGPQHKARATELVAA
jgi:hypothetical protein